jgi:hypothetical protein
MHVLDDRVGRPDHHDLASEHVGLRTDDIEEGHGGHRSGRSREFDPGTVAGESRPIDSTPGRLLRCRDREARQAAF